MQDQTVTVPSRVLVVEDDADTRRMLVEQLSREDCEVISAASGPEALVAIAERGLPDLAIVDLCLPGMDGFTLCRMLQASADIPVIILSALCEEETVVQGIEEFAEDYVTKPFSPRELMARVHRVLKRNGTSERRLHPLQHIDDYLTVDLGAQRILVGGAAIALTPTESKLLHILLLHQGQTVAASNIIERIWPAEDDGEGSLRVHVHRLREKVEPNPAVPRYILTKRGLGYSFGAAR